MLKAKRKKKRSTHGFVKEKPLQRARDALPVVTYALGDERTTYISQETAPSATSRMMRSKSDIKRQKAPGTAGERTKPR